MAIDLNAIKAKLKAMGEGKPRRAKWKPTEEHVVRCLPLPGDEDIALVLKWHYGVDGGRQMLCPGTYGDDCEFCNFAKHLKSWKDENGKDKTEERRKLDWEFFKKVDAATKHYVPVVLRKKDSVDVEGPFLWEMTPKTYQALFKICANDDWNEDHPDGGGLKVLTSLTHALDVVVTLKKKGTPGNQTNFDLTDVEERKKFSALIKGDIEASKALVAKIPDISEIAKPVSTEEAARVFETWKAALTDEPAGEAGGVEHGSGNAETVASGGKSVDDVVNQLTNMLKG